MIREVIFSLLFLVAIATPVFAQVTSNSPHKINFYQMILTAVFSILTAAATALITANFRLREIKQQSEIQQEVEKEREKSKIRIQYLNPLYISSKDLSTRLNDINSKLEGNNEKEIMLNNFRYFDENTIVNEHFGNWCNSDGYFCISTLYLTSVYFLHASRVRFELPFIQLSPNEDRKLLAHLSKVREAFGGRFGIWEIIQDSIGTYIKKDNNSVMNYREFCKEISDKSKFIWFGNLIGFYKDVGGKKPHELKESISALKELLQFLEEAQKIKT
jgi:hypothetical protein